MIVSRRDLFRLGAAAGLVAIPGLGRLALAADGASHGDALVVIFQRGGCDGLSLVAPVDDPDYVADRTPELRVQASGPKPGRSLRQTLSGQIDFRLHPEAAPLADLYEARQLALVHAAGLKNETRSHFVAQDLMDRGLSEVGGLKGAGEGWLTRWLAADPSTAPAVATTPAVPQSLAFHADSLAIPDLRGGLGLPGGQQPKQVLTALYGRGSDPFSRAAADTLRDMEMIESRLPRGGDGKVAPYQPEQGAAYEETESGRSLQTVARLIKMDIGLKVACVDIGGWDHHDNLAGRFASLAGQFTKAMAAFWNDTWRYHDRLTVVVMTEFGRRLRTNKSGGADHGHGGVMMVLSGHARGGDIYGRWPGLAASQLDNGVDLAVTTDYRTVLAEILTVRMGLGGGAVTTVLPGFAPDKSLGIVT